MFYTKNYIYCPQNLWILLWHVANVEFNYVNASEIKIKLPSEHKINLYVAEFTHNSLCYVQIKSAGTTTKRKTSKIAHVELR